MDMGASYSADDVDRTCSRPKKTPPAKVPAAVTEETSKMAEFSKSTPQKDESEQALAAAKVQAIVRGKAARNTKELNTSKV